jgi:hypothetical protein
MVVTWLFTIVSFGMRMKRLSKVRSLTERVSMERTRPTVSPTWITSSTSKGFSPMRKNPEITLETEVWEAKPTRSPRRPRRPGGG